MITPVFTAIVSLPALYSLKDRVRNISPVEFLDTFVYLTNGFLYLFPCYNKGWLEPKYRTAEEREEQTLFPASVTDLCSCFSVAFFCFPVSYQVYCNG